MNPISVSVIIPIYNAEKSLRRCIHSVLNASLGVKIEIILINDGSTDSSANVCDELEKEIPQIKIQHQKNYGVSAARNRGIRLAQGKYILFVDSDDWITPSSINTLHAIAEKHKCDIVHGEMVKTIDTLQETAPPPSQTTSGLSYLIHAIRSRSYNIVPVLKFVRREYLLERKIQFIEGVCYEDHLFTLELLDDPSSKLAKTDLPFYYYESNPHGITNSFSIKKLLDICIVINKIQQHIKKRKSSDLPNEETAFETLQAISFYHISSIYARLKSPERNKIIQRHLKHFRLKTALHGYKISARIGTQNVLFKLSPTIMSFIHSSLMRAKIIKR